MIIWDVDPCLDLSIITSYPKNSFRLPRLPISKNWHRVGIGKTVYLRDAAKIQDHCSFPHLQRVSDLIPTIPNAKILKQNLVDHLIASFLFRRHNTGCHATTTMDSRIRTAWHCFVVVTGTVIILLGAFSIVSDEVIAIVPKDELFEYDRRLHGLLNALPRCAVSSCASIKLWLLLTMECQDKLHLASHHRPRLRVFRLCLHVPQIPSTRRSIYYFERFPS